MTGVHSRRRPRIPARLLPVMKILLVLAATLLAVPFAAAEEWKTYINKKFGYSIEYPARASSNSVLETEKGRLFEIPGEKYSQHVGVGSMGDKSLDEFYKITLDFYKDTKITYKVKRKDWFVVSGVNKEGEEYYYKLYRKGGQKYLSFHLRYPHAKNKTYDRYVERIAKSFKPSLKGN